MTSSSVCCVNCQPFFPVVTLWIPVKFYQFLLTLQWNHVVDHCPHSIHTVKLARAKALPCVAADQWWDVIWTAGTPLCNQIQWVVSDSLIKQTWNWWFQWHCQYVSMIWYCLKYLEIWECQECCLDMNCANISKQACMYSRFVNFICKVSAKNCNKWSNSIDTVLLQNWFDPIYQV